MRGVLFGLLRLLESLFYGILSAFFLFFVAGVGHEYLVGTPSDGFLFQVGLYGSPVFLVLILYVWGCCWSSNHTLKIFRWSSLVLIVIPVALRMIFWPDMN